MILHSNGLHTVRVTSVEVIGPVRKDLTSSNSQEENSSVKIEERTQTGSVPIPALT